jgi:hypothetical protein
MGVLIGPGKRGAAASTCHAFAALRNNKLNEQGAGNSPLKILGAVNE